MATDLSSYKSIATSLFVKWDIPDYDILYFSTHSKAFSFNGDTYDSLGSLLNVTASTTELKASRSEVSVSVSGIPPENISAVMSANVKGSSIVINRGYFNNNDWSLLSVGTNPSIKFQGIVNNFSLTENFDSISKSSSFTITLICSSAVGILLQKVSGRRTNPLDESKYYPSDKSMNRVPNIKNSNFNFGAPPEAVRIGTK